MATQEVLDACHHRGLNACVVHPSGIMGPGDFAVGEITQNLISLYSHLKSRNELGGMKVIIGTCAEIRQLDDLNQILSEKMFDEAKTKT